MSCCSEPEPEPEPELEPLTTPLTTTPKASRPRASHFVSLQICSDKVLEAVRVMQTAHCQREPRLTQYAIEPVRLHLTVLVLALPTAEAVQHAAATFRAAANLLVPKHFSDGVCEATFTGLGTFGERVVFLDVADGPAKDRLCGFASEFAAAFQHGEHALPEEFLAGSQFTPHATVYKLSNSRHSR
jgi:hypothetical protein